MIPKNLISFRKWVKIPFGKSLIAILEEGEIS
jgi:hypothetical protein